MSIPIVSAQNLVGMANAVELYGAKAAGYATLFEAQSASPVPFNIPEAFAIPVSAVGDIREEDLRATFAKLVDGRTSPTLLMARSSHRQERSGENESPMFPYFPPLWEMRSLQNRYHFGSHERGFQSFRQIVEKMRNDPDMGILASANVAGYIHHIGARRLLGGELVSFVANTHSPIKPSQMEINVVQGLGTRAVAGGSDAVIIRVDRESGAVSFFEDITHEARGEILGSDRQPTVDFYRQREIDFYDLASQHITLLGWSELFKSGAKLFFEMDAEKYPGISSWIRPQTPLDEIRLKPFGNAGQLTHLIGILQYLAKRYGPSQIEGAFATRSTETPTLYQYLALPDMPREARPLKPFKPHLHSTDVMGIGTFEGPLVYSHTVMHSEDIQKLDRRFAETGYILLAHHNTHDVMDDTSHCRCRLSINMEGTSSHPVTLMADQIAKNPKTGFVFAMEVKIERHRKKDGWKIGGIDATEESDDYSLFPKARLDSNGEELVVEILS